MTEENDDVEAQVLTHERFVKGPLADRLKELGVEVSESLLSEDEVRELGLKEPSYGETIVGECTAQEARTYLAFARTKRDLEDRSRNLFGRTLASMGKAIAESDRSKPLNQLIQEGVVEPSFDSDDEAEEFFRLMQLARLLETQVYWSMGERLKQHRARLGVRSKLRVVTVANRYQE